LGAAVALAGPTNGVDGLVLINPAGFMRLRVTPGVLRSTVPWLLRPTKERSRALLEHMTAPGTRPDARMTDWMTLVARYTKPTGAPGPLPAAVTARWSNTPRSVLSGAHDCFLPTDRLRASVREVLGVDLTVLAGLAHLSIEEDPAGVAERLIGALPSAGA
jgi:pimeloyl-ACP methyl ester carboxylesterase